MSAINDILSNVPIPKMVKVRQNFESSVLENVDTELKNQLANKNFNRKFTPGMSIAVTAGSRGVANMALTIRTVCDFLKEIGCKPFIIPAMGSHGGSTAEGQRMILSSFGITEETMGVPIVSSMEAVCIYEFEDGFKVYVDKNAHEADGIVVINRVKPHTSFRGAYESGLIKMMTVGMGKQLGADQIHAAGPKVMGKNIARGGKKILELENIICGVALLENSYDQTCGIYVLEPQEIIDQEPLLQEQAKKNMPHLMFEKPDVLAIDYIGKNISGPGMDPNITHTFNPNSGISTEGKAHRIIVFDLTEETHGAGAGVGNADFTTKRLFSKFDADQTYPNLLTAGFPEPGKMPMLLDNQKLTIQAAIKTAALTDSSQVRMVRIKDTLHLGEIEISEAMLTEAKALENIEILSEPYELNFNEDGDLF